MNLLILIGNFSEEAQLMRNKYYERALTAAEAVKSAMGQTNSEIYKCDPKSHIQGTLRLLYIFFVLKIKT